MIREALTQLLGRRQPALSHSLGDLLGTDGCPIVSPDHVARALLERLDALPGDNDGAVIVGAIHALSAIEADLGWLPGGASDTAPADRPLHRLLHRAEQLGLPCPTPVAVGPDWSAWSWRKSGAAVAHAHIKNQPSRVWLWSGGMRWDWGATCLLQAESAVPLVLDRARVDAPRFSATQSAGELRLKTEARKARVILTQSGPTRVRWTLGWTPSATPEGLEATHDDRTLTGKLDKAWSWQIEGNDILGEGASPFRCAFELR